MKIRIEYRTGDSFSSRDAEHDIELEWEDVDTARDALRRIREHYEWYKDKHDQFTYRGETQKEYQARIGVAKDKDWYVEEYDGCLMLPTDRGEDMQFSAFWCGWFETLYSATIIYPPNPQNPDRFDAQERY